MNFKSCSLLLSLTLTLPAVAAPEIQSIRTDAVWLHTPAAGQPCGTVQITSRGITNFWFRLYNWRMPIDAGDPPFDRTRFALMLEIDEPVRQWAVPAVPAAGEDFSLVTNAVPAPLTVGGYVLAVSTAPAFSLAKDAHGALYAGVVQVSDLAAETLDFPTQSVLRVLSATNGQPVAGAEVVALSRDNRNPQRTRPAGHTDKDGLLRIPLHAGRTCDTWVVMKDADILVDSLGWRDGAAKLADPEPRHTLLLTDRAVYQPGERVYYKGIYYTADQDACAYAVRPGATYTLRLLDPADKALALQKHAANDFGSFAGAFVLPTNCPAGRLTLIMGDAAASSTHITVWTNGIPPARAEAAAVPAAPVPASEAPAFLQFPGETAKPGDIFQADWLGGDTPLAFGSIEIWESGRLLQRKAAREPVALSLPVTENLRGGFTLRGTLALPGRTYSQCYRISVPWDDRRLTLAWAAETIAPKPGDRAVQVLKVSKPAEVLAVLYDASKTGGRLPEGWAGFTCFREEPQPPRDHFSNGPTELEPFRDFRRPEEASPAGEAPAPQPREEVAAAPVPAPQATVFLPQLITDSQGQVEITYTQPPAGGDWRLWVFAHDRDLRSAQLEKHVKGQP